MSRVTPTMLRLLRWLAAGYPSSHQCRSQGDYGGRYCTTMALARRGLIRYDQGARDWRLSGAGRRYLAQL